MSDASAQLRERLEARSSLANVRVLAAKATLERETIARIWMNKNEADLVYRHFGSGGRGNVERIWLSIDGHGLVEVLADRFVPHGRPHLEFVRAERRLFPVGENHG